MKGFENPISYSLQENCLGWIIFILFGLNVVCFGNMLPTFVLCTLMCRKYIGRPFTVKNSPWTKRDISLGPCLEKMTPRLCQVLCSKTHTESSKDFVGHILQICIPN